MMTPELPRDSTCRPGGWTHSGAFSSPKLPIKGLDKRDAGRSGSRSSSP